MVLDVKRVSETMGSGVFSPSEPYRETPARNELAKTGGVGFSSGADRRDFTEACWPPADCAQNLRKIVFEGRKPGSGLSRKFDESDCQEGDSVVRTGSGKQNRDLDHERIDSTSEPAGHHHAE